METASPYKFDEEKKDPENYVEESDSEFNSFTAIIAEGERLRRV
jgi:hypothetical protein